MKKYAFTFLVLSMALCCGCSKSTAETLKTCPECGCKEGLACGCSAENGCMCKSKGGCSKTGCCSQ